MPEGVCTSRTAVSLLLTFWPPGPPERAYSIFKSLSGIMISRSSSLENLGNTSTREKDVCLNFLASNGEIFRVGPACAGNYGKNGVDFIIFAQTFLFALEL